MTNALESDEVKQLLRRLVELLEPEKTPKQELHTIREVAEILGRSPGTIYDWCRMERVKSVKRGNGRFISREEVERLQSSHCELAPPNLDKVPPSLKSKYSASQSVAS